MKLETKIIAREILKTLYRNGKTLGTAESCTGGRIAEAIISIPGASKYFKGGVIAYDNEVKENLLHVSHEVIESQTAVCEEVAVQMVKGACEALRCDYAISVTGIAGPEGGMPGIPVGTIWIGYGSSKEVRTFKLTEDFGRDINLAVATNKALKLFLDYYKEQNPSLEESEK